MSATRRLVNGILAGAIETGNILDPATVFFGLFLAGPVPDPPGTVADFTLPNATAYPAVAITTWGAVQYLADGSSAVSSPPMTNVPANAAGAITPTGWYLATAVTGGNVLMWGLFPTPIPMADEHHPLTCIVRVALPLAGSYEATVAING